MGPSWPTGRSGVDVDAAGALDLDLAGRDAGQLGAANRREQVGLGVGLGLLLLRVGALPGLHHVERHGADVADRHGDHLFLGKVAPRPSVPGPPDSSTFSRRTGAARTSSGWPGRRVSRIRGPGRPRPRPYGSW